MATRVPIVVIVAVVASTRADAQPMELAWQAPASCPDGASVRTKIEQRLGRPLDDVHVSVSIDVTPDHGARRFVAHVDLRAVTESNDVRTLTSSRCDDLADAVSLIVARVATEAEARRASPIRVATAADVEDTVTVTSPLPTHHPRLWGFGVRLSGISGVGVVPEVGWGGEVAGYVRRKNAFAELARMRWLESTQRVHSAGPAHVDVGLDVTSFRMGWRSARRPLRGWLAVDVGHMDGTGVGLSDPRVGSGRWVAGGAGFGVAWPMSKWARLVGSTEAVFAFERVRFRLDDGVVIYQPAPMAARATVGLEVGWQ